jgi:vesicle-associated membrane protein 7
MFPKRTAFAYLEDIKELFCQRYSTDVRINAVPNGMQATFEDNIKAKMQYYNSQPENEKMQRLQNNLNEVKD